MGRISDFIMKNKHTLKWQSGGQMAIQSPFCALVIWGGGMPYLNFGVVGASAGVFCYISVKERKEKIKKLADMVVSEKLAMRTNRDSLGYQILGQYMWLIDDPELSDDEDFSSRPVIDMENLTKFQAELIDVFLLKAGEEDNRTEWLKDSMEASDRASYDSFPDLHEHAAGIAGSIGFMQGRGYLAS